MKRKILIIVLCLATVASYAQSSKKRRKPKPKTTTQQQVKKPDTTSIAQSARPLADTSKKLGGKPGKHFDRPLDGYYKKAIY
ncbi:hypothetical protein [Mucilaginibacter gotjawali]|uniref:hypothetical protein n=1 Tax=Mucilaginibacter gotjawali TaxID=1550579 RepID=UPI001E50964F|nr:hypothetical protein [Mucilaginibacter gotjawali]